MKNRTTPSSRERATPSSGRIDPSSGWRRPAEGALFPPPPLDLCRAVDRWLSDGRAQGWSTRTLNDHRQNLARFAWWLEHEEEVVPTLAALDPSRVHAFLGYLRQPHREGRFGSGHPGAKRAARPSSVATYYRDLRAFTNFCRAEGLLEADPLKNVKAPRVPNDQIVPLEKEQIQALLDAARRGRAPERDVALILLLLDTGMRVSELCGLTVGDVDRRTGELTVVGKENKKRRVYMGQSARRALWRYLETDRRMAATDEPLFVSYGGLQSGGGLQRSGVGRVISNMGTTAGVGGVRVSPHSLRHTFAINFLRGGGSVLEPQALLGHQELSMVRKYVMYAEADLAQAHRAASPADRMKLR